MIDEENQEVGEPQEPAPEPAPKKKPIFLSEMSYELMTEAIDIRRRQERLVKEGCREQPWPVAMRRADVFEACARLLDEIAPRQKEVMELVRRRRWK